MKSVGKIKKLKKLFKVIRGTNYRHNVLENYKAKTDGSYKKMNS